MKEYEVSCQAVFDVTVKANSPEEAERIMRETFHHALPSDPLQGHEVDKSISIRGVKTYEYTVEETIP